MHSYARYLVLALCFVLAQAARDGLELHEKRTLRVARRHRETPVLAVIGVMTAFSSGAGRYDYARRRQYLRKTWFPGTEREIQRVEHDMRLVVRFVVGLGATAEQEAAIAKEEELFGSFIHLPVKEGYKRLFNKTQLFWKAVSARYKPDYVIKVDDDKYVRLDRLPYAIRQWRDVKAQYIGCFQYRYLFRDPASKWYDPQHRMVALKQEWDGWLYAEGPFYVLAGHVVDALANMPLPLRAYGGSEDIATGVYMKTFDVKHWDDPRLCEERTCSASTIALNVAANQNFPSCCTPAEMDDLTCFMKIHEDVNCQLPTLDAEGKLPITPPRHNMETDHAWLDAE